MPRALFSVVLERTRSYLTSTGGIACSSGVAASWCLLAMCHHFLATWGTSLPGVTALGFALALGIQIAGRISERQTANRSSTISKLGAAYFALAAWTVGFGALMGLFSTAIGRMSLETLASPILVPLLPAAVAVLLLAAPAFWIARLPILISRARQPFAITPPEDGNHRNPSADPPSSPTDVLRHYLVGIVLGILFDVLVLAPVFGIQAGGLLAALAAGIGFLTCIGSHNQFATVEDSDETNRASAKSSAAFAEQSTSDSHADQPVSSRWQRAETILIVACFGGLLAVMSRMIHQLTPVAAFVVYTQWTALIAGVAFGLWFSARRASAQTDVPIRQAVCCLVVSTFAILLLSVYPLLIDGFLALNALVSLVWLQMTIRIVVAGLPFFVIGAVWTIIASLSRLHRSTSAESLASESSIHEGSSVFPFNNLSRFSPLALLGGYFTVRWFALGTIPVVGLLIAFSWVLMLCAFAFWWPNRQLPQKRIATGALVAVLLLVSASPLWHGAYTPGKAAKLLFDSNVFMVRRAKFDTDLLPFLDEGRLSATVESDRGTFTVWRYRSTQFQIRENGIPKTIISSNPAICPQYSAELMPLVLPMVLHEQPHRLLILGLGGGVPLAASTSFPVQEVTCVEADAGLITLMNDVIWPASGTSPLEDDRVRLLQLEPALAVSCREGSYDVIVCSPDQLALMRAMPYTTRDFYSRAASQLATDGIFCQRFQQADFGPQRILDITKTMQSAFDHVAAIEVATGELLLLATNSDKGITREGLVERVQRPHVRRSLSQLGWDWSVPLNLKTCESEALAKLSAEQSSTVNTAANGRLAFSLPKEVMRWAPKWKENHNRFAPYTVTLLNSEHVDERDPDLVRRISELVSQRELMTQNTDQPWAYRKKLREQMKKKPRSIIKQVKGESPTRKLHPDERRRKSYFKMLGAAHKREQLTTTDIDRVAAFAEPYDPLLAYFVHSEVAELYTRLDPRDVRSELDHRLHLAYYSQVNDRSVRNVIAALRLATENSDAYSTPQQQYDEINALMQMLKAKWENRGTADPGKPRIVLNDIELSVSTLEASFAEMERLNASLGQPSEDWQARRTLLERSLVRPLRTLRSRMLPHHLGQQRKKRRQMAN